MAEIDYRVDGVMVTKRIADISEGGVFIDTPVPAEVGTRFALCFSLDGTSIRAEGIVRYSQPYIGMGVEFTELSPEAAVAIRNYVAAVVPKRQLLPVGAGRS